MQTDWAFSANLIIDVIFHSFKQYLAYVYHLPIIRCALVVTDNIVYAKFRKNLLS